MKILLIFGAVLLVSISNNANPIYHFTKVENINILPDLSQDREFVKTVIEIYTIQSRILETKSEELIKRSVTGTLTNAEKNILAINLGYNDYAALNNSFESIGISVLALRNKYVELNDQASANPVINKAIDKLIREGRITLQNNIYHNVCLRALFGAICQCFKTSTNCTVLGDCVRTAYAQYETCKQQPPPPR